MGLPVKTGNIVGDPETLPLSPCQCLPCRVIGCGDEVRLTLLGRWAVFLSVPYIVMTLEETERWSLLVASDLLGRRNIVQ